MFAVVLGLQPGRWNDQPQVDIAAAPVLADEELEMLGEIDFLLWLDETDAAL